MFAYGCQMMVNTKFHLPTMKIKTHISDLPKFDLGLNDLRL